MMASPIIIPMGTNIPKIAQKLASAADALMPLKPTKVKDQKTIRIVEIR